MIEHNNLNQGSEEWFRTRSGIFTASNAEVALPLPSKLKKGETVYPAKRDDYMYKIAVEKILGRPADSIDPAPPSISSLFWPRRGIQMEGEASDALAKYARDHQVKLGKIEKVGFCTTDDGQIGASPDRWIKSTKTTIEIKCVASWNQAEYLDANEDFWMKEHYPQVQCQMLVTGYSNAILFCYHPRMPPVFRPTVRNQAYIDDLYKHILNFNEALAAMVLRLRKHGGWRPFKDGEQESFEP